jgi:hypothetical protein
MTNAFSAAIVAGLLMAAACLAADGIIRNDTVWRDTDGNEIWCNGGHMIREGDTFWWVGYDTAPGHWPWKVNLYSSKNLADWKFENAIIRRERGFANINWAGRPALLHNRTTGKYIVIFEATGGRWVGQHKVGFAVCDRINGDYEFAGMHFPEGDRTTGDQSVYQEGDDAYLLCTLDRDFDGRRFLDQSLAIFKLTADYLGIERKVFEGFDNVNGNTKIVPRNQSSREASHIVKVGDTYYWFSSGLEGWNSSMTMYATAKDLAGPWSELKRLATQPTSRDTFNTQHDFVIPIVGSETTTYVYVGDRYSQHHKRGVGRNIFLPLTFIDGQPLLRWVKDWRIDVATGRVTEISNDSAGTAGEPLP